MDIITDKEDILVFGKEATIEHIREKFENTSYSAIEFNNCTSITVEEICAVIPLVNKNLRTLIVKNVLWFNDECVEILTAYCNKITKLELLGCLNQITRSGIESIGRNCSSLTSLSILSSVDNYSDSSAMSKLHLWVLDNRLFPALINNMTSNLEHFALSGFSLLTNDALEKFLSNFRLSLLSLDFSSLTVVNDVTLNKIGSYCHHLLYLKLNFCKNITDCGIESLIICRSELMLLELSGCDKLSDNAIQLIGENCKKLETIKLAGCTNLTQKSLNYLSLCENLSFIDMERTSIKYLPCSLTKLMNLKHLNITGCQGILFPSLENAQNQMDNVQSNFSTILDTLREYNVSQKLTCFVLGNTRSGKTSLVHSLIEDSNNIAEGETLTASVTKWYPFNKASDVNEKIQKENRNLVIEVWDWGGRKAMESFPSIFFNKRSMFVITFNLTVYSSALYIPYIISMIQSKVPGSFIIIVGCFSDLSTVEKVKYLCDQIQLKIKEREEEEVKEINDELKFIKSLGAISKVGFKIKKLESLLDRRPAIYKDIIVTSNDGKGCNELREVILKIAVKETYFPPYSIDDTFEQFYIHLCLLKNANIVFLRWHEILSILYNYGVTEESQILEMVNLLEDLGCLLVLNKSSCNHLASKFYLKDPTNNDLVCINLQLFADVIGKIHSHSTSAQQLLNELTQKDYIRSVWPGKKPYEWTLRKAFDQVIENGLLRETIIPLLLAEWNLSVEQVELVIEALQLSYVMFSSVTNAAYDLELVVPKMKNLSIYKLYHLPMQGRLPYITQINAWLSTCPSSHVEVGWIFRFLSVKPPQLFLSLISACIPLKLQSQILGYWQTGSYIKVCDIVVNVSQCNEKSSLQVLARVPLQHGSRHAVNRGWSCLAKYLYTIEKYLQSFNGIYYEILSLHSTKYVPLLEVIDKYETGYLKFPEILWWIPIKNSDDLSHIAPISSQCCLNWLESIAAQYMVYVSHSLDLSEEVKIVMQALQDACFEVSNNKQAIFASDLIIIIVTSRYFEGDCLSFVKNNANGKRIVLAIFEEDFVISSSHELLCDQPFVDISGGVGNGISYVPDYTQFRSLIEMCNITMFGHGTLGEENKRGSVLKPPDTTLDSSFRKPANHISEIIRKCSTLTADVEMRKVASTAVASAVALATAEHIAKQSCPTMGAKAAAMAAAVADAVANGDSEKAAKAVVAAAEAVDEAVAFAWRLKVNKSLKSEDVKAIPRKVKSSFCTLF
ncbi:uncharacterized protein LOC101236161 isoform X3 [Hydra vulgaris]|uniref:Uncharacterized protein LOC101236161 isoform X3 n=2 Tax=Hydra vulgaris TaxID=6087 RepID=A0ABM4DIM0_HYDVU